MRKVLSELFFVFILVQSILSFVPEHATAQFYCDENQSIPYFRVNDNICDCENGRDEPQTSACSQKGIRFVCEQTGQLIYMNKVMNGVCDCCDGSDEPKLNCPNTCNANKPKAHALNQFSFRRNIPHLKPTFDLEMRKQQFKQSQQYNTNQFEEEDEEELKQQNQFELLKQVNSQEQEQEQEHGQEHGQEQEYGGLSQKHQQNYEQEHQEINASFRDHQIESSTSYHSLFGKSWGPEFTENNLKEMAVESGGSPENIFSLNDEEVAVISETVESVDNSDSSKLVESNKYLGYFSEPDIYNDIVVFILDDEIWKVNVNGGTAVQLTSTKGEKERPRISPDGETVAYSGTDEGSMEVWIVSIDGGVPKRLTYVGYALVVDWTPDGQNVVFESPRSSFHSGRLETLYKISIQGGLHETIKTGWSHYIAYDPSHSKGSGEGGVPNVVGRFTTDIAYWKRYRGGQRGQLFFDEKGDGKYEIMFELDGAIGLFSWIGNRIYFTSDYKCINAPYIDGNDKKIACSSEIYSIPVVLTDSPSTEKEKIQMRFKQLEVHTKWEFFKETQKFNFYIRNPQSDGKRMVFQKGADIFFYDIGKSDVKIIPIEALSDKPQLEEYTIDMKDGIQSFSISGDGSYAGYISRGRVFMQPIKTDGPIIQFGQTNGMSRYRQCGFLASPFLICATEAISSSIDSDRLVIFQVPINERHSSFKSRVSTGSEPFPSGNTVVSGGIGRIVSLRPAPTSDYVAIVNNLHHLLIIHVPSKLVTTIDTGSSGIQDVAWSPDSQWVAFSREDSSGVSRIRIVNIVDGDGFYATDAVHTDSSPCWDPSGRFIYFLSNRFYKTKFHDHVKRDPVSVATFKPYLILLSEIVNNPPPFSREPAGCESKNDPECKVKVRSILTAGSRRLDSQERFIPHIRREPYPEAEQMGLKSTWLNIPKWRTKKVRDSFESGNRILPFPVDNGFYESLTCTYSGIIYQRTSPDIGYHPFLGFNLETQDEFVLTNDANSVIMGAKSGAMVLTFRDMTGDFGFCLFPTSTFQRGNRVSSRSGLCPSLQNVKIKLDPLTEWRQIFVEAWKYQRDNFWSRSMNGLNWILHRDMYLSLVPRLGARSQLNDLVQIMQADLGTSHAFYRSSTRTGCPIIPYRLGADLQWSDEDSGYVITHIVKGDVWDSYAAGPFSQVGVNVHVGDVITQVNNKIVRKDQNPHTLFIGISYARLNIKKFVTQFKENEPKTFSNIISRVFKSDEIIEIELIKTESPARYRDWVEATRRYVHETSGGKLGYIHIPDMVSDGWSELHRYITYESVRKGLILDLRYNGGGYISEEIADILSRKVLHLESKPNALPTTYPRMANFGPKILLINEGCASDCEIFSQTFCHRTKYPLPYVPNDNIENSCKRVGTRTWGGVIGIDNKGRLVDGTVTTQPEYAFWFYGEFDGDNKTAHSGWGIENWGVTPDILSHMRPHEYESGDDPQLFDGIALGLKIIKEYETEKFVVPVKPMSEYVPGCKDLMTEFFDVQKEL